MSTVAAVQPDGTPTWVDLGIPDLDKACSFYGALFGWQFQVGPEETGHYTMCLMHDRPVAAMSSFFDPDAGGFWWNVYLATSDCDATVARGTEVGGTVLMEPMEVMDQGRIAMLRDPAGAQIGLWQGRAHIGAEVVNEPGAVVRNDLVTAQPDVAREFYAALFDFTADRNEDIPGVDFTFLRRRDGHEVAGILGNPNATASQWATTFEVADTDAVVAAAKAHAGSASAPEDMVYGRIASVVDPFGTEFSVIQRASG
ncbi:VOC family protein [Allosaccharopolyspora coralli]|uniref:VOC family protein n=2 Tax=Allosaccharopolyspora coralli TaxID=2665642 RepID=A0A5Q3QKZ0_9PSEU|nr:VOC family protein [Allosaccharopolyspora coralli]